MKERIRTHEIALRAQRKTIAAHKRKAPNCYKAAYSRKQALTQCNLLLSRGEPYLRTYKCWRCSYWHLTHLPEKTTLF
jgi:hypothetical protein